jgi:hypothetical protein
LKPAKLSILDSFASVRLAFAKEASERVYLQISEADTLAMRKLVAFV